MEIEGFFRLKVFIHEFLRCCYSSSSGGVMLTHKRKMGLLTIDIERMEGGGGCNIQMESPNKASG